MISTELQQVQSNAAKLEKNQLVINEETTLKEWKEIGQQLSLMQGNIQFWIGDWIRFGEKKGYYISSDVYDEVEEITGLERQTVQVYKSVCDNVPSLIRIKDLSFNHHREVAKLCEGDQTYFLNKASQEKLSVRELRLQILCEFPGRTTVKHDRYENDNPFPLRLGDLHLKLQEEAFAMKTSIHERAMAIIREYFDRKEGKLIEVK